MRGIEVIKKINRRLDDGLSRQEIVDEFKEKLMPESMPAFQKYMAAAPDPDIRIKYRKLNILLFSLLIYFPFLKVFVFLFFNDFLAINLLPVLITIIVFIFFAINIRIFRGDLYNILGLILGLFGAAIVFNLYTLITESNHFRENAVLNTSLVLLFDLLPTILAMVLSFYIARKVFPHFDLLGRLKETKSDAK